MFFLRCKCCSDNDLVYGLSPNQNLTYNINFNITVKAGGYEFDMVTVYEIDCKLKVKTSL